MRWYLTHGANHAALIERGAPIPPHMTAPEAIPGYDAWFSDFWELSTERRISGGPIPASAIRDHKVNEQDRMFFHRCIRGMDRVLLDHYRPKKEGEVSKQPLTPDIVVSRFGGKKAND